MPESFVNKKQLRLDIAVGETKLSLQGFRASVDIDKYGGITMGMLHARVYGVSQSDMNTCTTFIMQTRYDGDWAYRPNLVQVVAIDGKQESLVFSGNIINAFADYSMIPDVFLRIEAQSAALSQLLPVAPRSYREPVDVATVMGAIASSMGLKFEGNGVKVRLPDTYLAGTDLDQARTLAQAAGIGMYIDDTVLAITQTPLTARKATVPLISPSSGLIGYPQLDGWGVSFSTLFNPAIKFGSRIKIESDVTRAAGEWLVASMSLRLESEVPGGAWMMRVRGNRTGVPYVG